MTLHTRTVFARTRGRLCTVNTRLEIRTSVPTRPRTIKGPTCLYTGASQNPTLNFRVIIHIGRVHADPSAHPIDGEETESYERGPKRRILGKHKQQIDPCLLRPHRAGNAH